MWASCEMGLEWVVQPWAANAIGAISGAGGLEWDGRCGCEV